MDPIAEVRRRVLEWAPKWCAHHDLDVSAFDDDPDFSFLTPTVARWFLAAVDKKIVAETGHGSFALNEDLSEGRSGAGIFQHGSRKKIPQPSRIYVEGFLEVASAGRLSLGFDWPAEYLSFQSPREVGVRRYEESRHWAFDLLAYSDRARTRVHIACEIKATQAEVQTLIDDLRSCGARGKHREEDCASGKPSQRQNHHRKYQALLEFQPAVLWLFGPNEQPVFGVQESAGGVVLLEPLPDQVMRWAAR
jgi:hypothetical protein